MRDMIGCVAAPRDGDSNGTANCTAGSFGSGQKLLMTGSREAPSKLPSVLYVLAFNCNFFLFSLSLINQREAHTVLAC